MVAIETYIPIIILVLLVVFLMSFEPLPPTSKKYSFTDYLLDRYGNIYGARNWGWFVLPLIYLLIGGNPIRNIREMPLIGWIVLALIEIIISLLLYWRYKIKKKRNKRR